VCVNPLTWLEGYSETPEKEAIGAGREANQGSVPMFHPHYNWMSFLHAGEVPEEVEFAGEEVSTQFLCELNETVKRESQYDAVIYSKHTSNLRLLVVVRVYLARVYTVCCGALVYTVYCAARLRSDLLRRLLHLLAPATRASYE
jgi:hypothetical protein